MFLYSRELFSLIISHFEADSLSYPGIHPASAKDVRVWHIRHYSTLGCRRLSDRVVAPIDWSQMFFAPLASHALTSHSPLRRSPLRAAAERSPSLLSPSPPSRPL